MEPEIKESPSPMPSNVGVQDRYPDFKPEGMLEPVQHQPTLPLDQDTRQSLPEPSEEHSDEEAHSHQEDVARSESSLSVDSLYCDQDGRGPALHDRLAYGSPASCVQPQPVEPDSSSATSGPADFHEPTTDNHPEHSASTSEQTLNSPIVSVEQFFALWRNGSKEERRRLVAIVEKQIETWLNQDGKYYYGFAGQYS
jgi:hypothetical protein